ncbi:hypothetical protein O9G_001952 [Rozella allomycis CSF55]|uniref:Uncharacterized protein n=1 Tax=Rozella allomycis (strain CSF55) TaxID=988480 RepID=A0A075ATR1_ROZAC|nr:hypothetical protein O9G_001952 [Rozella allomycis CSF55]|eukprot:EPZ31942.1 hypothetical protein O9G_001952 [Rozella allomycis CSF55]
MTGFFEICGKEEQDVVKIQEGIIDILNNCISSKTDEVVKLVTIESQTTSKTLYTKGKEPKLNHFPSLRLNLEARFISSLAVKVSAEIVEKLDLFVRPKKVDHISLAYMNHFTVSKAEYERAKANERSMKKSNLTRKLTLTYHKERTLKDSSESSWRTKSHTDIDIEHVKPQLKRTDSTPNLLALTDEIPIPIDIEELEVFALHFFKDFLEFSKTSWDVAFYELEFESETLDRKHVFREIKRWKNVFDFTSISEDFLANLIARVKSHNGKVRV